MRRCRWKSCVENLKASIQKRPRRPKWLGLSGFAFVLMVAGAAAHAQQPKKMPRIGYLSTQERGRDSARSEAIRRALRERGYIEGKNIIIEYRYADGKSERYSELAAELVRQKVDVIFANSTTIAFVAKDATKSIPIVFPSQAEPVAAGLVDSLARPGGNLTGFATIAAVLAGKRLELFQETITKLSRVGVLWEPKNQGSEESWKESQLAARQLGLKVHSIEVTGPDKFESAFSVATKTRIDAVAVTLSGLFSSHQKLIVSLAGKRRIPAIYTREEFVEKGGLMSYRADDDEPFNRIAVMIDKILKGTTAADIPVEQPKTFELIINLKAADQIGLTIPPQVLARADRVIR